MTRRVFLENTDWQNTKFKLFLYQMNLEPTAVVKTIRTVQNKPNYSTHDWKKIRELCVIYVTSLKNKQKTGTCIIMFLWNILL